MFNIIVLVLIQIISSSGLAFADASSKLKDDFERTEAMLNTPELTPQQILSYAADARCLLHMPCFDVSVWIDKSDVYFEVKSSQTRDVCRQTVISSPEKIIVKTKCYRNDAFELMNGMTEFRPR